MIKDSDYLTAGDVASRYKVSKATIWRWLASAKLPKPVHIVGTTRWRLVDLLEWETAQQQQQQQR